ncbi:hypothetical protein [Isoptericola dokdonensis]|uniref:hypothetical protein n=1 Tax=Isoptericola dokdonensis TaxID=372663 RepID=UPI00082F27FB|nr:hypothetical protein [Isoptericola dokdonensis]
MDESVARLAAQWSAPDVLVEPDGDGVVVRAWEHLLDVPLVVELDPDELRRFVDAVDPDDAETLWPGRPVEWVAYALLSVHLEETIATASAQPTRIALRDRRLVVVATR